MAHKPPVLSSFLTETHTVNDGMETVSRLRGVVLLNCTDGKQLVARLMELSMRAATDVEKRDEALINPLAPPPEIVRALNRSLLLSF
jgi:hypothetical protein